MPAQKRIQNAIFVVLALLFGGNFSAPAFAVETSATVIDFYNLSQDKEWDWLSQGLADMLITDLSSVDHFQIVDREGLQKAGSPRARPAGPQGLPGVFGRPSDASDPR